MDATTKTEQAHNAGKHATNPSRRCAGCWEVARAAQRKLAVLKGCKCGNTVDPVDYLGRCEACAERADS